MPEPLSPAPLPVPEGGASAHPESEPVAPHPQRSRTVLLLAALGVAAALAAGSLWLLGRHQGDLVTESDRQAMAARIDQAEFRFQYVRLERSDEFQQAQAALALSSDQNALLLREVSSGHLKLAWLTLWDYQVEDLDRVEVNSGGLRREVTLLHQPTTITVPVGAGLPIVIRGVHDGGGGVTLGVKSGEQELIFPPLPVGQSVMLTSR